MALIKLNNYKIGLIERENYPGDEGFSFQNEVVVTPVYNVLGLKIASEIMRSVPVSSDEPHAAKDLENTRYWADQGKTPDMCEALMIKLGYYENVFVNPGKAFKKCLAVAHDTIESFGYKKKFEQLKQDIGVYSAEISKQKDKKLLPPPV